MQKNKILVVHSREKKRKNFLADWQKCLLGCKKAKIGFKKQRLKLYFFFGFLNFLYMYHDVMYKCRYSHHNLLMKIM